jgi:hypothetical protein
MEAPASRKAAMNPIVRHMLIGVGIALVFLFCVGALGLWIYASAKSSGDLSGAGGILGFMIVPLAAFAGAPWSLLLLDNQHLVVVGILVGPLINGAMLGALSGCLFGYREDRSKEVHK